MVVVLEWRHRELQPRGPLRRPADVRLADLHLRAPGLECFAGRGGAVEVGDGGRVWGAYVMLGRRAPPRAVTDALSVIRSLRATSPQMDPAHRLGSARLARLCPSVRVRSSD